MEDGKSVQDVMEFPESVEEHVIEGSEDMMDDDVRVIDIQQFDCGEILQIQNQINEARTRTNNVAGELERTRDVLKKLMEEERNLQEKLNEKTKEIKDRYQLEDGFDWQVDPYSGTATGKRKD